MNDTMTLHLIMLRNIYEVLIIKEHNDIIL